jgi:hypothetical protein
MGSARVIGKHEGGTAVVQSLRVEQEERTTVLLRDGVVVIDGLVEDDSGVVALVEAAADPERAVRACLQVGARASAAAGASLDTLVVEQAFGELVDGFSATVGDAVTRIVGTAEGFVDEDSGPLPALLSELKGELTNQLGALFDPDSKSSALARMEAVFTDAAATQAKSVRAVLDPADDQSPLGRWKAEVLGTVREQVGLVLTQLTDVTATMAAGDARRETFKLTSVKGEGFEDQLHPIISALAGRYGDLAEHVGRQNGAAGTKRGDEVVTLNDADTGGHAVAIVFEAKHRKLGMRRIMEELDDAMENRSAACAVAVFAEPSQSPTGVPFTYFANKAIVVLDPDAPSDQILELAYMWARWEARKALALDGSTIDVDRVEAIMCDARRGLTRISTIRRCHSTAKRQIEAASGEVDALVSDVDGALRELALELRS